MAEPHPELTLGLDPASLRHDFTKKLLLQLMKFPGIATRNDHYLALAYVVRDRILDRWVRSARTFLDGEHRTVLYLSAEYLLGPQLANNVLILGIEREVREALTGLGLSYDELVEHEEEPGLGNGGLGRLAACFLDSLATLELPAIGHGIRYEFGIFDQEIRDGWQHEKADRWLRLGYPWEVRRHEIEHTVGLGGTTETYLDDDGRKRVRWLPERAVKGVAYDTPFLGAGTTNANLLRLWTALSDEDFDLEAFQAGEYRRAVEAKVRSENITKVLYPSDETEAGKQLRLEQEYFFVSCALQDSIRLLLQRSTIDRFADKFAIQLNDTHPSLAVPELMRLLVDIHRLEWDDAWQLTTRAISYTNHTLLPEALETWPLPLMARLLPRHVEIIYEINRRFLDEVRARRPGDEAMLSRVSLIDERDAKRVRMAHVATVASHTVNGVAALHSKLLTQTVLADFATLWPERFTNVTNGVTPRRFVALANPGLSALVTEAVGAGWQADLERLRGLEAFVDDPGFRARWREVKLANKRVLAAWLERSHGIALDPTALLDVQIKRIHEYKRQHLNLLHVAWLLRRLADGKSVDGLVPRTILIAGKAAPSYRAAKLIIRLAHALADAARDVRGGSELARVVFVPDFNVKNAQRIYPAADLSEQISTAGMEASGTGNMKLTLNGALTIGTLDGANIEIRDAVGAAHFFLFGLTAEEVQARRAAGYDPRTVVAADPELAAVLDDLAGGRWSPPDQKDLFAPMVRGFLERDAFFVLADFRSYLEAQARVAAAWREPDTWTRASILNTARAGRFSSDRAIREYAERIWKVSPVKVT
ncbi:MAG TPA: glycogen/starch/alpha-glucan phosphorylase [Kofleriaceae bacterium]|nr:glycogen/starch/alpha-glucan phosphorylase [Kofleriaceae bacterium]